MKRILAIFLLLYGAAQTQAAPFPTGDAKAGKKLFEKNKCNRCHIDMMGGDGSAIFTRPDHKVTSPEKLVQQMHVCSGNVGITLSAQDEQNLGAYLNQRYYKFK